ncbi:EAL domain-containing protein [Phyllobacterium sp. 21LDTY02-6]|uniref:EAL domain-containing protein n=1 Tax=Phyllobacterium sp. 21LDTY02-6 TaxID=2944903 RepID=UPI002020D980|nr:EAL domain-containing protein [Phyllobacterium sp. 21LDTY02-6]MCO4319200.1 EAL domain-containing protein [Phyllobacterium sp. 21LDTY02-6]
MRRSRVPVAAVIGLPLLALLLLLFAAFGVILRAEQTELVRVYSERTAQLLAEDLARHLAELTAPSAEYFDTLHRNVINRGCDTSDCIFDLIPQERLRSSEIPAVVNFITFGDVTGRLEGITRLSVDDAEFLGRAVAPAGDRNPLTMYLGNETRTNEDFVTSRRPWYATGITSPDVQWSPPYNSGRICALRWSSSENWRIMRVARIDGKDGQPLGVLGVEVCLGRIAVFLQEARTNTLERVGILTPFGQVIAMNNGVLEIKPYEATDANAEAIYASVPVAGDNLSGWKLMVELAPEFSEAALWDYKQWLVLLCGLLFSLGVTAWVASRVVTPLQRLSQVVTDLGSLRLDRSISVRSRISELGILADVIERMRGALRENQQRLEFLAYHDTATGHLNHAGLAAHYAKMQTSHVELLLIDIRNSGYVSGIYGPAALDHMVGSIIALLGEELDGAVTGIVNGHQIACLIGGAAAIDRHRVGEVFSHLQKPVEYEGLSTTPELQLAVSSRDNAADQFDDLLRRAMGALHHALESGTAGPVWHNSAMVQNMREVVELSGDVAQAVARGEFAIELEPVLDLETRLGHGAHSRVVWHHPQLGTMDESRFLPVLEKTGAIRHVGFFALSQSFEFLHMFGLQYPAQTLQIAIDIYPVQLLDPLFIERVSELRRDWDIKADNIRFVMVPNTMLLEDQQLVRSTERLRSLGFHLSLDQSSRADAMVQHLSFTPYDSFLMDLTQYLSGDIEKGLALLRSTCRMADELGMEAIVADVGDASMIPKFVECGCGYGMGPALGLPMAPSRFMARFAVEEPAAV